MNLIVKSIAALIAAFPLVLGAQGRSAITVAAGPSFPVGTFRETQAQGVDVNVGVIRGAEDSPFGVRFDFDYDRLPGKTVNGVRKTERRVVGGTADLIFTASGYTFKPYFLAGAGAFKATSKAVTEEEKTRFGFDFGVGLAKPLGNSAILLETRLNSISQHHAKPLRYLPIVVGFLF